jgi:hypothetical protein
MAKNAGYHWDDRFDRIVTLLDGRRVRLRWIRPTDASLLREGFARLSETSRRNRFFIALKELPDHVVRYFTDVDGVDHAALVALSVPEKGLAEQGLGVARFVRSKDEPLTAEVAVTVVDEVQRLGLGTLLLGTLAAAASERNVEAFTANVLWSNSNVRFWLLGLGAEQWHRLGDAVVCSLGTSLLANRAAERSRIAA